jgi:hypothetical protein
MHLLKTLRPPMVVDVRKRPAFEAAPSMLPGAVGRDPHAVEQWAAELPSGGSVVVYCVHGHEVSRRSTSSRASCAEPTPNRPGCSPSRWACARALRMLRHGFVLYEALYLWCRELEGETHSWPSKMTI